MLIATNTTMENIKSLKFGIALILVFTLSVVCNTRSFAQLEEPEVERVREPKTPLSEGVHNSLGLDIFVTNFGLAVGGHYSRVLGPYTQLTFRTGITGIRDVSEQNFQSFLTGQEIIPNKYKRAFGFPFVLGLKQRLFAQQIEDSFRLYVRGGFGPAMAFTYPYVQDGNDNGFRDFNLVSSGGQEFLVPAERVNDFFSGWSNGETEWGLNGEIAIGADLGSSFSSETTVEFGYFFYYFKQGLQIMEPYRPTEYNENGFPVNETKVEFNEAQEYFGTPQIKFTFGFMW